VAEKYAIIEEIQGLNELEKQEQYTVASAKSIAACRMHLQKKWWAAM
jgi:hypothetical protein